MKILVTGATGFLGSNLIPALLERGDEVTAWRRRESDRPRLENPRLRHAWGDLADASPENLSRLKDAMSGCQGVVHLAAKTSQDPSSRLEADAVNIEGTERLLDCAKSSGVRRFVYASSQSAKISNPGIYGATKKKSEELVLRSGLDAVVLRPAIIYGPGNAGIFSKFVKIVKRLPVIPVPWTEVPFQPVYVGDVVGAVLGALDAGSHPQNVYDVAGPDPVTFPGLISRVARTLGLTRPLIPVPMGLAILGARLLSGIMRRPPVTVDNLIGLTESTPLDLGPMARDLKVAPMALDAGLALSLKEEIP
ncbi:MAG: hypothetical protein A2636_06260 [Elusimicrobia bacterium RIFCSPHIGHO2_01_FULL_64_10]|nr:MAG: hypothetical protein A2636_06260 [Elusimicrobia bacterium RIFCSPHIGHO2_01_FULL_64_10]